MKTHPVARLARLAAAILQLLLLLLPLLLPLSSRAAGMPLHLATLEWPPFVGANLPDQGLSAFIVSTVGKRAGLETKISYYPWARALQVGATDPSYAGSFPAYSNSEREKSCYLSHDIGQSVLGFAHLKSTAFDWKTLDELKGMRIGVVHGYSNGELFDRMVHEEQLQTDTAPNDVTNLHKLLAKRIPVIVIDRDVLRYLLQVEPSLKDAKNTIVFHPQPINQLSLHICFQRSRQGQALRQRFDAALKKTNLRALEKTYFEKQALAE